MLRGAARAGLGAGRQRHGHMGMADFDLSMACMIDIDVIATFPQTEPWVPMAIQFLATEVPIEGFC